MQKFSREYQQKLVSAEFAANLVNSHDWVDYGNLTGQTVAFDEALAQRVDELNDVKIWTILPQYIPKVMEADKTGNLSSGIPGIFPNGIARQRTNSGLYTIHLFGIRNYPATFEKTLNP